jgi:hypothetical protein
VRIVNITYLKSSLSSPPGPSADNLLLCVISASGFVWSINWDNWFVPKKELITDDNVLALIKSIGVNTSLSLTFIRSLMVLAIRAKPTPNCWDNCSPTVLTRRFDNEYHQYPFALINSSIYFYNNDIFFGKHLLPLGYQTKFCSFYNDLLHLSCNVGQKNNLSITTSSFFIRRFCITQLSVNMLNSFFSEFVGSFVTYYEW